MTLQIITTAASLNLKNIQQILAHQEIMSYLIHNTNNIYQQIVNEDLTLFDCSSTSSAKLFFKFFISSLALSLCKAMIWQASIAAFLAPLTDTTATGTPFGICNIERIESNPSRKDDLNGT